MSTQPCWGLAAAALALGGPGQLSLDAVLDHRANRQWMRIAGLASVPVAAGLVFGRPLPGLNR